MTEQFLSDGKVPLILMVNNYLYKKTLPYIVLNSPFLQANTIYSGNIVFSSRVNKYPIHNCMLDHRKP